MSDRCWMTLTCRRGDEQPFLDAGFVEQQSDDGKVVVLVDEQADYAHSLLLKELAERKLEFYGENGPGDEYGGARFYASGGKYAETGVDVDGDYYVTVSELGIRADLFKRVMAFIAGYSAVVERIHGVEKGVES